MEITIEYLREKILDMATVVEKMFAESVKADSSFEEIVELENQINKYHTHIDDMCFKFVALKRPLARDLRLSLSIIKMNSDFERIGDLAFNIKRAYLKIGQRCELLKQIFTEVALMLKNAIDSFVQGDVKLATDVIQHDQIVDELNKQVIQTYTRVLYPGKVTSKESIEQDNSKEPETSTETENPKQPVIAEHPPADQDKKKKIMRNDDKCFSEIIFDFDQAYNIILVSNKMERIGDHCTNIAEDVIFLESGKDIRHQHNSFNHT